MNLAMSRAEFEKLPFRDELVNEPIDGARFRDRHHPGNIFKAQISDVSGRLWGWECFKVELY